MSHGCAETGRRVEYAGSKTLTGLAKLLRGRGLEEAAAEAAARTEEGETDGETLEPSRKDNGLKDNNRREDEA